MSDLISRREAIEAVHEEFDTCTVWDESGRYTADEVERILDCVPSAQPDRWIPVAERLPEKTGKYLVTVKNGNVYATAYCAMDKKFNCAAVAWMELPEPYKEEGDNE